AQIVEIEPISLDCHARVRAEVPVRATKEHLVLGRVYRTDTVDVQAAGDVDTCVEGERATLDQNRDGDVHVRVPAGSIRFERPRVDLHDVDTDFEKGLAGKVTDALPWVADDQGLTTSALAFAQDTIGGSECMQAAYDVTEQMLIDAYTEQAIAQGLAPEDVSVTIMGQPDFDQNEPDELVAADEFDFEIVDTGVLCEVAPRPADEAIAPEST
ncbi:MAG: hypothetical protein ACERLM_06335, partial [Acidimicrobiales bacterium]